ncbi:hypothetical protein ADA01nite_40850 [Aneurinibacillus danicus]|uniref:Uncharacterized protein n=1 Tax=Aneurinibacillus danicus TaxID=267746 RepID=A0A511VCK5_9BACL|nr:hypothetical protein ADA01nite_40850 [Aneurinibacillus danicus]
MNNIFETLSIPGSETIILVTPRDLSNKTFAIQLALNLNEEVSSKSG